MPLALDLRATNARPAELILRELQQSVEAALAPACVKGLLAYTKLMQVLQRLDEEIVVSTRALRIL